MTFIALSLGSNLGDRALHLAQARAALLATKAFRETCFSSLYETPPLLPPDVPVGWNLAYLNQVMIGHTQLEPLKVLTLTQSIETRLGRVPAARWAPRIIDVDLLMMDALHHHDERLTLPHAGLLLRPFVLIPMAECVPDLVPPGADASFKELAALCHSADIKLFMPNPTF